MSTVQKTPVNEGVPSDSLADKLNDLMKSGNTERFHVFTCPKEAMRMVTPNGFRISFVNHKFITQNDDAIEYLKSQLDVPGVHIKYEGEQSYDDVDPSATERKKFIAEMKAKMEALNLAFITGNGRQDHGIIDSVAAKLKPATSDGTASK